MINREYICLHTHTCILHISRTDELRIRMNIFLRQQGNKFNETELIDSQVMYNSFFDSPDFQRGMKFLNSTFITSAYGVMIYVMIRRNETTKTYCVRNKNRYNEFILIGNHVARIACEIVGEKRTASFIALRSRHSPAGSIRSGQHVIQQGKIYYRPTIKRLSSTCYSIYIIQDCHLVLFFN